MWLLGGEALSACRGWRAGVEKCGKSPRADWKGGPGCHTLQRALLGGKWVIPAPVLLLVNVKSGSQGRETEKALESSW